MKTITFDDAIEILRNVGERLVPYNYPLGSKLWEKDLLPLKIMDLEVDGYSVTIHFNKSKYQKYYLETFQVYSTNTPFLPFHLVTKMACKMLGSGDLSLIEFYQNDRKVYCWSVCLDDEGKPIPSPISEDSKICSFQGFEYKYMNANQLTFY